MLRTKTKPPPAPPTNADSRPMDWEMRPGGMLVQKRTDSDKTSVPAPTIRVRVKYGSVYHEIPISSQASFGKNFPQFLVLLDSNSGTKLKRIKSRGTI